MTCPTRCRIVWLGGEKDERDERAGVGAVRNGVFASPGHERGVEVVLIVLLNA